MIVTPSSNRFNVNHGVFSIPLGRYCKELEDVISVAKMNGFILPTHFQLKVLNVFILELISNGIWSKLDYKYVFGYNSLLTNYNEFTSSPNFESFFNFSRINLKNPSIVGEFVSTDTSAGISPFFNRAGMQNHQTAGVSTGYFNTNFYPGNTGNKWQQNDASFMNYLSEYGDQSAPPVGGGQVISLNVTSPARRVATFVPRTITSTTAGNLNRSNNSAEATFVASGVTENAGFHSLDRTASTLTTYYKNGVSAGTSAQGSGTIPTGYRIYLINRNIDDVGGTAYVRSPLIMASGGGSLGSSLQVIHHQIAKHFTDSLGNK